MRVRNLQDVLMRVGGKLTRDKVVKVALRPERKLADEGKPGQQPGSELLGERGPFERLPSFTTPVYACLIGQGNGSFGVGNGTTTEVGSSLSGVAAPEIDQTLCEIGGGDGKEEEK